MSHPQMSTAICRNRDNYQHQSSWAQRLYVSYICVCVWVSVAPQVKADRPRCLFNLIRGCHPLMSAQWISKRKLHLLPSMWGRLPLRNEQSARKTSIHTPRYLSRFSSSLRLCNCALSLTLCTDVVAAVIKTLDGMETRCPAPRPVNKEPSSKSQFYTSYFTAKIHGMYNEYIIEEWATWLFGHFFLFLSPL